MDSVPRHLLLLLLLSLCALAGQKAPKADNLLSEARAMASQQHKGIFLVFGASWCPDCRIFDRFFARPEIGAVLDKYFVVVHLNVFEEAGGGQKDRSNSGAENIMFKCGGISRQGELSLPFSAVLDEKGSLLMNSYRPVEEKPNGENMGFPAAAEDIAWFMTMVKHGAPSIAPEDAHVLEDRLRRGVPQ